MTGSKLDHVPSISTPLADRSQHNIYPLTCAYLLPLKMKENSNWQQRTWLTFIFNKFVRYNLKSKAISTLFRPNSRYLLHQEGKLVFKVRAYVRTEPYPTYHNSQRTIKPSIDYMSHVVIYEYFSKLGASVKI